MHEKLFLVIEGPMFEGLKITVVCFQVYTSSLSKLYDRDIKNFFEHARQLIGGSTAGNRDKKNIREDASNHSSASHSFDAILETVSNLSH